MSGEHGVVWQVQQMLKGGAPIIQYRDKDVSYDMFKKKAREILSLTRAKNVPLIINDRAEVALEVGADGVHVGQSDLALQEARKKLGPDKIVGVTVTCVEEARQAEAGGADYLGISSVFSTSTKPEAEAIGLDGLQKIVQAAKIPTVAIGGIHADNLEQVLATGVTGVAVVSEVCMASDVAGRVGELRAAIENFKMLQSRKAIKP